MATLEEECEEFTCDDEEISDYCRCPALCKCMICKKEYTIDLFEEDIDFVCQECDEELNKE
jgi:hypothetical protein